VDSDIAEAKRPHFEFIHNFKILENLHPIEWLIQDIIVANSLYYDFGDPGSFKSFVALDRLLHIAAGIDYHGHRVKQGTVFYIAGEGQQGIGRRIAAWHIVHRTSAADIPFFLAKTPTQLMDPGAVEEVSRAIEAMAKKYGPPAVVHFDTLARNFGEGDENSTADMNRVVSNLDSMLASGICLGLTHHTGHANKSRARGSIALHGAADTAFRISQTEFDQVLISYTKMKDAPVSSKMLFDLHSIPLIIRDHHDQSFTLELVAEGDEVVGENRGQTLGTKVSGNMKAAIRLLDKLYAQYEKNLRNGGLTEQKPLVSVRDFKEACLEKKVYAKAGNFNRGLESMLERDLVRLCEKKQFICSAQNYLKYFGNVGDSN